jgi:hypothetical protein
MKSYSFTHVLSVSPQAGPVGGVSLSSGFIEYLHIAQAIINTLSINIE